MIRRAADDDFLLIAQTDHAILAQQLACHFGNAKFAPCSSSESMLTAVAMHDQGWPLHDDQPTLNAGGLPLDVFEVPRAIALKVWAESARLAAIADPYAGLLVSLHSLSLSINATQPTPAMHEKFDMQKMHDQFAVNKFQHREVERQEQLRHLLHFNTHIPLKHGVPDARLSPRDDLLRFDFRLLQAMDLLSLCLCCTNLPQGETNDVLPGPTVADAVKLRLWRNPQGVLHVDPWPFDMDRISLSVPAKRVAGRPFESLDSFHNAYRECAYRASQPVGCIGITDRAGVWHAWLRHRLNLNSPRVLPIPRLRENDHRSDGLFLQARLVFQLMVAMFHARGRHRFVLKLLVFAGYSRNFFNPRLG